MARQAQALRRRRDFPRGVPFSRPTNENRQAKSRRLQDDTVHVCENEFFVIIAAIVIMLPLLKLWRLEKHYETLEAQEINDLQTLQELINSPGTFKSLFPLIGVQLQLKKMCRENLDTIEIANTISVEEADPLAIEAVSLSTLIPATTSDKRQRQTEAADEPNTVEVQPVLKKPRLHEVANFDLKKLMTTHPVGAAVLKIYEAKQTLSTQCQSYVCGIIILHFLSINCLKLSNDDLEFLAHQIVRIFPNECTETYYVPPVLKKQSRNNDKSCLSKGKLVDKYRNQCTFIRSASNSQQKDLQPTSRALQAPLQQAEISKAWLKNNSDPEDEVITHWKNSYSLRVLDAENHGTFVSICIEWPILKLSKGYKLLQLDFFTKYGDKSKTLEKFCFDWNNIFPEIITINESKVTEYNKLMIQMLDDVNISENTKHLVRYQLLSSFIAPKSNKIARKGKSKQSTAKATYWKPSLIEAQEGIVLLVNVPGDIENEVAEKRTKMSNYHLQLQPFIIVVGQTVASVEAIYIRVDDITYETDSFLSALYILFQIYLTVDIEYPLESANTCYFIQWLLFEIETNADVKIPAVYTLINRLRLSLKKRSQ